MKLELKRIIQILVVLSVLTAAFVYRTLEPTHAVSEEPATELTNIALCEFNQGCEYDVFGQQINISSEANTPVLAETPLPLRLTLGQGMTITKAYLKGKDMFMGTIPVIFNASDIADQYQGELLLGACITESMVWQLTIELDYLGQSDTASFDFEMRNH
ncbi:hypothetical protein [Motilimonas eburnea]|uniref:hypothetical protein n=1 Tax=Motilimonas eburnea TaxID=1737488 RepID=UPI001E3B7EE6|nr:hypothetical protein [Motilimonas eburnea]MCE2570408.1 hypothetical protein [Motilimonas eburnea]